MRIGLVGAGPWAASVHAPGIAAHPATELTAVWARRPEAAAALGAPVAKSYGDLLDQVDAVAFAVPPAIQADLAIEAAKAGKHLILEKPVAGSVADAERLADAAAGVTSVVVFIRRFAPEVREWLAGIGEHDGWAGGTARWLSGALLGGPYSGSAWRHDGGALADVGPHVFDLLDAALGRAEVISTHRTEPDLWTVVLRHESGATSSATLSMRLPMRPTVTDIAVFGEAGYRELTGRLTTPQDAFVTLLDEFTTHAAQGTPHPLGVERGLRVQRLLARAAELA